MGGKLVEALMGLPESGKAKASRPTKTRSHSEEEEEH